MVIEVDVNLAAAIIKAGSDYAASLGSAPQVCPAAILLGDTDPAAVTEEIL